ncbi:MAG: HDOD domain-containing protein [Syntrophorhabdaceae bacterium]|nr:HDOD domain-containing protein [Syntrophorhabdaceae bacterium]
MKSEILKRANDLKVIPTLNTVISKVFEIINNNESSFNDLAEVLKYDQAISSKIISIANSAYYSRGIEIYNLQHAMLNIGFEEVKRIILCIMFMENMLKSLDIDEEDLFKLWKHSIFVSSAAKRLAEKSLMEDPQKVYTASLFHDIGKVVFYMEDRNYSGMELYSKESGKPLIELEQEHYGTDHQETGHAISIKWKFPERFRNVIRNHHNEAPVGNTDPLLRYVTVADRFYHSRNGTDIEYYILQKEEEHIIKEMEIFYTLFGGQR